MEKDLEADADKAASGSNGHASKEVNGDEKPASDEKTEYAEMTNQRENHSPYQGQVRHF
jgi:hypothetical protein